MSFLGLLLRNLRFHGRGNLAVLLGVVVGTVALTGALLVGDSLRGSLQAQSLRQLGWVEQALMPPRMVREALAAQLNAERIAPVLLQPATAVKSVAGKPTGRRVGRVSLLGVDERFWPAPADVPSQLTWRYDDESKLPHADTLLSVALGATLAEELDVRAGDTVLLALETVSAAPRESFLGRRDTADLVMAFPARVAAVLPQHTFGSQFTLQPSTTAPRNAYLPLQVLQAELRYHTHALNEELRSRDREDKTLPKQPVNLFLAAGATHEALQTQLRTQLQLEDWGLVLREPRRRFGAPAPGYLSLESQQLYVPASVVEAVAKAKLTTAPTLAYLVNNMAPAAQLVAAAVGTLTPPGSELTRLISGYYGPLQVPYCVVAALEPRQASPFGPFLPQELSKLDDDEILLVDWPDSTLREVKPGTRLALTFFDPNVEAYLQESTHTFRVAAHLPIAGPTYDPNLTPQFPGITDRTTLGAWNPPFAFDRSRIREADEEFWRKYRTTPKGYINLKAGQKLWGSSRFGDITSLRIAPQGETPSAIADKILAQLQPKQGGLEFEPVRANALAASVGSQDFGMLFLGFSFFLIIAALLLVGLLVRLNIDRRATEIGLLLALGLRRRWLQLLLLGEGAVLALLGGAMGMLLAEYYAELLLSYLRATWPGGLDEALLSLHTTWQSRLIGYAGSVLVSVLTIGWATRSLAMLATRALLHGQTEQEHVRLGQGKQRWSILLVLLGLLGGVVCFVLGLQTHDPMMQAFGFLLSGMLLLIACLAGLSLWLRRERGRTGQHPAGLTALALRNAARHPLRSMLTVGLLAFATFMLVAVQAFQRSPTDDFLEKTGGSGGFALVGESNLPFFLDLNDRAVQAQLAAPGKQALLQQARFYACRASAGEDASCKNLYKARQPRVLGVPDSLVARDGFQFGKTEATTGAPPWELLRQQRTDGAIPVLGEMNTVLYGLKSSVGGVVEIENESGAKVKLHIAGVLKDSVFRSELLMSEANFRKVFPGVAGFRYVLIETPRDDVEAVRSILQEGLADYGLEVTPSAERVAMFLAVENTYLALFQALGGLGLLLGALGLAVVLLRSVWERRGELALLRALGFRRSTLARLVLVENAYLLVLGLGIGTGTALVSIAPHAAQQTQLPWGQLAALLAIVLAVGLLSASWAVLTTVRAPLLPALRKE